MTYIILDLEFNGAYSKKKHRFINEIIEFGAVKCDEKLNITDTFSALVTPRISKKLNSHVSQLTHINMTELQESNNSFAHVLSRFKKFLGDGVLMSWGTSDVLVLMENYHYYFGEQSLPFLKAYVNLQTFCERALDYQDAAHQMGLSACAQMLGIGFEDDALHRALTDAELTSLCFQKLYTPELLAEFLMPCDGDFYQRITFRNYNICDAKSPEIDKREFYFNCDCCGHKAWRRGKWKLKNKSFRANFRCMRCKRDFEGRITFKKTYDGVRVIRRAVELPLTAKIQDLPPEQEPITEEQINTQEIMQMQDKNQAPQDIKQEKKPGRRRHRSKKPKQAQQAPEQQIRQAQAQPQEKKPQPPQEKKPQEKKAQEKKPKREEPLPVSEPAPIKKPFFENPTSRMKKKLTDQFLHED